LRRKEPRTGSHQRASFQGGVLIIMWVKVCDRQKISDFIYSCAKPLVECCVMKQCRCYTSWPQEQRIRFRPLVISC